MKPKKRLGEEVVTITGPVGDLDARYLPVDVAQPRYIAVVCHPHPLFSGTMDNKIVTTCCRLFRDLGIPSMRFNFRGVGASEGLYADGQGETDDLAAVVAWLQQRWPDTPVIIAGFSFGSYVAYRYASMHTVAQLICIAPPVHHFGFNECVLPTAPIIVAQGMVDEVVPADQVLAWVAQLAKPVTLLQFDQATHFFHGQLLPLRDGLTQQIKTLL